MHDENILLLSDDSKRSKTDVIKKFGVIDFEDIQKSYFIIDLAMALCYFMIASKCDDNSDILSVSGNILNGYVCKRSLTETEWNVLFTLVCGRYVQELVLCEVEQQKQTDNEYLRTCFKDGRPQIKLLMEWGEEHVMNKWQTYL